MIPILFEKTATTFTTYGIGALSDALSCVVTEERNGRFELEMEYPTSGIHFNDIQTSRIILAKPSDNQNPQAFRIYKIDSPINERVMIYAEHISYQLNYVPIKPITATSCADAMSKIVSNSLAANPFTFTTNKNVSTVFTIGTPRSVRSLLGGMEGSLLQQYQGEYKWDNYTVSLLVNRGSDNGVVLRYGKNITDFEQDEDLSDTVTGIQPYWVNEDHLVMGDITLATNTYPYERIETVDVTSDIELPTGAIMPTKAQVTQAGADVLSRKTHVVIPSTNIRVSFVALWQTEEYKDIAPLEQVNLCDTVTVIYERLGIEKKLKVVKTVYDVLLERYNELEIGEAAYSISSVIATQSEKISDTISRIDKVDDRITLEVIRARGVEDTLSSRITLVPHTITLAVQNGTLKSGTSASISLSVLDENGNPIPSGDPGIITLDGTVVFKSNLSDGVTVISGNNLKTGTIEAASIYLHADGYWTRINANTGNLSWKMERSKLNTAGELTLMYYDGTNSYEALLLSSVSWTGRRDYGATLSARDGASFVAFGREEYEGGPLSFPLVLNFGLDPLIKEGVSIQCTDSIICYESVGMVGHYTHDGTTDYLYASIAPRYIQNYDQDDSDGMCLDISKEFGMAVTIDGYMVLTVETFTSSMRPRLYYDNGGADNAYGIKFRGTYADTTNKAQEGTASMQMDPEHCTYACTVLEAYFLANVLSDKRIKTNIESIENNYIAFYEDLNPVSFTYRNEKIGKLMKSSKNNGSRLGFLAQDIIELLDKHNIENSDLTYQMESSPDAEINDLCDGNVYKLNYDDFHALHVEYAHYLKGIIDKQQKTIDTLEARLKALEDKIK